MTKFSDKRNMISRLFQATTISLAATVFLGVSALADTTPAPTSVPASTQTLSASAVAKAAAAAALAAAVPVTDFLTPQTPILVGPTGHFDYMTIDAKNNHVFASHPGTNSLAVLDMTAGTASDIPLGAEVNGVAVDSTDSLFVCAGGGKKLFTLDRVTLAQKGEFDLPDVGDGICYDKDNDTVYVDNDDGTNVWAISLPDLKLVATIPIGTAPEYMIYDSDDHVIYQNIKTDDEIQVIDTTANKVTQTWSLAPVLSPHGLVYDSKSKRLYAAGRPGIMAVVDATTGKTLSTTPLASNVDQIGWDPGLRKIYCPGGGQLTVVSLDDQGNASTVGRIAIDPGAHTITVDRKTHTVYICYPAADGKSYIEALVPKAS